MVNSVGNVQLIQRMNRIKVLEYIRKHGPVARTSIAKSTNLSLSSITNIINHLLSCGLVVQSEPISSQSLGRRASLIQFNAAAMEIISIDIEPDSAALAVTDLSGNAIISRNINLIGYRDATSILTALEREVRGICEIRSKICAIGIAVNGHVPDDRGVVVSSIMRWKGVDVKSFFRERFENIHIYVTNNSKTKAYWQVNNMSAAATDNMIFLDLTSGVGIISFFDGKINESVAGELGHTTVMKDGPKCFCGNRGCLELVCSVEYILSRCRDAYENGKCLWISNPDKITFDGAISAFESGDEDVCEIFRECAEYLGIGIANIINIFEPRTIVINSDNLTRCDYIYKTALAEAERRAYNIFPVPTKYERVDISTSQSLSGTSQYVADKLLSLNGPEDILG